mmetsp:Transcript_5296/g.21854  ORF Transcript_5296/g.21854 Transcript_5296/m.21854 type:complete len:220 (-) Transcript_5296:1018-1677(-)
MQTSSHAAVSARSLEASTNSAITTPYTSSDPKTQRSTWRRAATRASAVSAIAGKYATTSTHDRRESSRARAAGEPDEEHWSTKAAVRWVYTTAGRRGVVLLVAPSASAAKALTRSASVPRAAPSPTRAASSSRSELVGCTACARPSRSALAVAAAVAAAHGSSLPRASAASAAARRVARSAHRRAARCRSSSVVVVSVASSWSFAFEPLSPLRRRPRFR